MQDEEMNQIYRQLVEVLGINNLGWIIQDVETQLAEGKLVEKPVSTYKDNTIVTLDAHPQSLLPEATGSKAKFTVVQEYTPKERLEILLDAIQSLTDMFNMESEIIDTLSQSISSEPISEIYIGRTLIVPKDMDIVQNLLNKLNALVEEIRREIDDAN